MKFFEIRLIVSFLGEKKQFNWWDSDFFTETGIRFLEINFPRTPYLAALRSVSRWLLCKY